MSTGGGWVGMSRGSHPHLLTPSGGHQTYGRQADGTHPTGMLSCYFPQMKFAKVMFLHVSVCPRGGGKYLGRYPPGTWYTPPGPGTPPGRYPPPDQVPPGQVNPPPQVHSPDQVHPGPGTPLVHSCFKLF